MRRIYHYAGLASVGLAALGAILPIVPTVPFLILAAWCFGKSNPAWEQRLLNDPRFGPHIRNWRENGSIAPAGKYGATLGFGVSVGVGFYTLESPWQLIPLAIAIVVLPWIWTRPDPRT